MFSDESVLEQSWQRQNGPKIIASITISKLWQISLAEPPYYKYKWCYVCVTVLKILKCFYL